MAAPKGRPSTFTQEVADEICEQLSDGLSLREVCLAENMPPESTVRRWAVSDVNGFTAQYEEARRIGYHKLADEMIDIADDGSNDWMERQNSDGSTGDIVLNGEHVQRSRLRLDTRKWMLSKVLPKIYGDKIVQEHTGPDGGPVDIKDSSAHALALKMFSLVANGQKEKAREESE